MCNSYKKFKNNDISKKKSHVNSKQLSQISLINFTYKLVSGIPSYQVYHLVIEAFYMLNIPTSQIFYHRH